MDHLPLNWIRTFERVARLLSFQDAASELHVTTGAVSQQVRKLEEALGVALFSRSTSPIVLTAAGEAYFREIKEPLEKLVQATRQIEQHHAGGQLKIWGSRFFMRLWLLQHLNGFRSLHPDIDISITTGMPNEVIPSDIDIAIRVGLSNNPDLAYQKLMSRIVVPICSPEYAHRHQLEAQGTDFTAHTLLRSNTAPEEWSVWAQANGTGSIPADKILTLPSSDLVHDAAMEGIGISLGRLGFIEKEVSLARLVTLPGKPVKLQNDFYIHFRRGEGNDPRVRSFLRWIKSEVALTIAHSRTVLEDRYPDLQDYWRGFRTEPDEAESLRSK